MTPRGWRLRISRDSADAQLDGLSKQAHCWITRGCVVRQRIFYAESQKKGFPDNFLEGIKNSEMALARANKIAMNDAKIGGIESSTNDADDLKKSETLAEFYYQSSLKTYKNIINKLFLALKLSELHDKDIKINLFFIFSESTETPKLPLSPLPLEYRPQIQSTAPNA